MAEKPEECCALCGAKMGNQAQIHGYHLKCYQDLPHQNAEDISDLGSGITSLEMDIGDMERRIDLLEEEREKEKE